MLLFFFIFLLSSILIIFFIKEQDVTFLRSFSLISSGLIFVYSVSLLLLFDCNDYYFQFLIRYFFNFEAFNICFTFGLDGISLFFFLLTTFLIFLCVLFVFDEKYLKYYLLNLFLIEFFLLLVFSVLDIFLFYIFFESILIPMYLLIGIWGSRDRKIWAAYLLFFYTLCGSFLMLLGILYMYTITGTFNLEYLLQHSFTFDEQYWLWLAFFLSFASKIPVFPLHIWLPEAHVEASTVGSVLLAGILLKLGVYGFLRFSLTMFPEASFFFAPMIYVFCGVGIVYTSFAAIRQTDLKRIIAYSSVAHMNLITLGLFCFNSFGLEGALLQSISHGFVASALFFLIGMIYRRYQTRFLYYYGGITQIMPLFSFFFLFFTLANIALPGTSSFVGEFLILMGLFLFNIKLMILASLSVVLGGSYSLWLCNKILFGNIKQLSLLKFSDLTKREFFIVFPLASLVILMGIFPYFWLKYLHFSVLLLDYKFLIFN
jgi:proton-translocating NADH-quinone oxidoreductase chain M